MEQRTAARDDAEVARPLSDYVLILIRRRRLVCLNVIVVAVVTAVVSLIVPSWYTSTGTLLPTESRQSNLGLLSMVESTFPLLGIPGVSAPSESMMAILMSRRVANDVIDENDLMPVFRSETRDDAVRTLRKRSTIDVNENGVLRVQVEAREPDRAASMVRSYIGALERYNQEVRSTAGRRTREFIEQRVEETVLTLAAAEESLAAFQARHASVDIGEQARAAISALAQAEAEVASLQIQLAILRSYASENHPSVLELESRIREQQQVLADLRRGGGAALPGMAPALGELPELGLELARRMREVEVQSGVYYLLSQELESAKIQEARDTPTIQVLDEPRPADRRTRPQRKLMVVIGLLIGLLIGIIMALWREFLETTDRSHPARRSIDAAVSAVREDTARLRGR